MDLLENPFLLFPEEVWAMILGKVEDSKDIQSAFIAFPKLEGVMSATRHLWMSDQAIPHLASWLSKEELLAFRQVCKPWYRAVDNFLVNHQSQRPCSSTQEPLLTGQIWTPEAAPKRYKLQMPITKRIIRKPEDVLCLLAHFSGHPSENNPFVGRSLHIGFPADDHSPLYGFTLAEYVGNVKELLQKYGHHIWFIFLLDKRFWPHLTLFDSFLPIVKDCIPLLPNLKGLYVSSGCLCEEDKPDSDEDELSDDGSSSSGEEETKKNAEKKTDAGKVNVAMSNLDWDLLVLPHLETIQIDLDVGSTRSPIDDSDVLNPVISSFSTQLRRLEIPIQFFNKEYAKKFPNLLELTISGEDEYFPRQSLADILLKLNAPKLTTLSLLEYNHVLTEADIRRWLKRFPHIRSVVLDPIIWNSEERRGVPVVPLPPLTSTQLIPSLTSLKFCFGCVWNFDLLLYFPFLEYLRVEKVPKLREWDPRIAASISEPEVRIREYLHSRDMYSSNVWELLPKLKTVTVSDDRHRPSTNHFTRAMYDHLRRGANQ